MKELLCRGSKYKAIPPMDEKSSQGRLNGKGNEVVFMLYYVAEESFCGHLLRQAQKLLRP